MPGHGVADSTSSRDWPRWINELSRVCRLANDSWWRDPATGQPIKRNKGELLALIHSEISECLEGVRKNLDDDHLPHRKMEEVELADALLCGIPTSDIDPLFHERRGYREPCDRPAEVNGA